jgi:Mg-chelatase subunit ChlD
MRRVSVALVIDTSSSMEEPTGGGQSKLKAAQEAATLFARLLDFAVDEAAVIGFDAKARVAQSLTRDVSLVESGIARLASGAGTNIAGGLRAASEELDRRDATNYPVIVILTDGRASVDPELVVPAASEAMTRGAAIFAIGLGQEIDRDQLRQVASRPEWYFESADGDDLAEIYRSVAVSLPCPSDQDWGRRSLVSPVAKESETGTLWSMQQP